MSALFVFGILQHPPVLKVLIGDAANEVSRPARLHGYCLVRATDSSFPVLKPLLFCGQKFKTIALCTRESVYFTAMGMRKSNVQQSSSDKCAQGPFIYPVHYLPQPKRLISPSFLVQKSSRLWRLFYTCPLFPAALLNSAVRSRMRNCADVSVYFIQWTGKLF